MLPHVTRATMPATPLLLTALSLLSAVSLLGCGGGDARVETILALTGDQGQGKAVYEANCKRCHGSDGKGSGGTIARNVAVVADTDPTEAIHQVLNGSDEMPAFSDLSDQEVADVVEYLGSLN
jgi:mono/diheme cytochrome c family protein